MLEVITGCMYSGKSSELIRRLRRHQIAGQDVIAFKSALDDRYSSDIATHPTGGVPDTLKAQTVRCEREFMVRLGLETDPASLDGGLPYGKYLRYESIPVSIRENDGSLRPFGSNQRQIPLPDVVGFDEVQFMDWQIVPVLETLANQGVRVIVAGLDLDADGKNFGPIGSLLARADKVTKLTAVCVAHDPETDRPCGKPATRSYRLPSQDSGERVQVGSAGVYEARCRVCWARGRQ
jgi:thymidine kinase